jgi:hypothetical protein
VCRSLKVLCAAGDTDRLAALRRACVSAHWELVGGSTDTEDLIAQLHGRRPDVVVVGVELGEKAVSLVRSAPWARIVVVGPGGEALIGAADAWASSLDQVREAVLGLPAPGGPVLS